MSSTKNPYWIVVKLLVSESGNLSYFNCENGVLTLYILPSNFSPFLYSIFPQVLLNSCECLAAKSVFVSPCSNVISLNGNATLTELLSLSTNSVTS